MKRIRVAVIVSSRETGSCETFEAFGRLEKRKFFGEPFRAAIRHRAIVAAVLFGSLVLSSSPVLAEDRKPVDFSDIVSPIVLRGDARTAFRDPTVVYHDGWFRLFFTLVKINSNGSPFLHVAWTKSRDLISWSQPKAITSSDQSLNYSSPGNIIRFDGRWLLCLQTYPRPNGEKYGNADSRLWVMRSDDLETWEAPELLRVKGPHVPQKDMGRMIDAYLLEDKDEVGKWWCFYKQNGVSISSSLDLKTWTYFGRAVAGENACVVVNGDEYLLFHSPRNGIGMKRSRDLRTWTDEGVLTLGQKDWPWAQGRLTAGFVLDLRRDPAVGKALMFFHGSEFPESNPSGGFDNFASIGIAWSDDLKEWRWANDDTGERMPRVGDHTYMWWSDGFPSHSPNAAWQRVIQTGTFAMALNTETLEIPHFGALQSVFGYGSREAVRNQDWQSLPPAELQLTIRTGGEEYRCSAGGKWSNFDGPRLVESGRFLQRADVTDLKFTSKDGKQLLVEARFETVAWSDRLSLILAVRPGAKNGTDTASSKQLPAFHDSSLGIRLVSGEKTIEEYWEQDSEEAWNGDKWREVAIAIDFAKGDGWGAVVDDTSVTVRAREIAGGAARPVTLDTVRGWYRVDLNGVVPTHPICDGRNENDVMERIELELANSSSTAKVVRLLFDKEGSGFRHRFGAAITGMSAVLRNMQGSPTGIPVQLSKNWHGRPEGGVYAGAWFHGFSQVRLPPKRRVKLELVIVYGHWGGVPAASHSQLCLIGWGSNQLWNESALGSWGESICYEPDQVQASAAVLDVRPLMVRSMSGNALWSWTHNVGGADFFRLYDAIGNRVFPRAMRTSYQRYGPCLTEVTYAGQSGDAIEQSATVSLSRTDDLTRGTYRLRMDVKKERDFSRLVLFQVGADSYSYTGERQMAVGDENGLIREWQTQWGGDTYRTQPIEFQGRIPWVSLHDAVPRRKKPDLGAWANRGIVIRSWTARLGGKDANPWIAEHGVRARGVDTSTADIVPPPDVKRLIPGDFVEATIEHIVVPQFCDDYYGPNHALRESLQKWENTWRMIQREAKENDRTVKMTVGSLIRGYPEVCIKTTDDKAAFSLRGGTGYVPITFVGLSSAVGHVLFVDDQRLDQRVHGSDFWQTDYDPVTKRWAITFNIPADGGGERNIRFH